MTICVGHNLLFLRDLWLGVNAVKLKLCNHKALWLRAAKLFQQPISNNYAHVTSVIAQKTQWFHFWGLTFFDNCEHLQKCYFDYKKLSTWGDQSRQVTTRCLDQRSSMNCLLRESFAPAWISLRENKPKQINKSTSSKTNCELLLFFSLKQKKTPVVQLLPLLFLQVTATVVKEEVHVLW